MPRDLFPETGRHTVPYKAAVWCGRLVVLGMVTWPILAFAVTHSGSHKKFDRTDLVVLLLWGAIAVFMLVTYALLRAAGIEFDFTFRVRIADRTTRRQFYRDLIWLPPR